MQAVRASAPGRVCLFGEHQDYLGLPVIAAAINLRIAVEAQPSPDGLIHVEMPDIGERHCISPNDRQLYEGKRDYLRSCVAVLQRRGLRWSRGYHVRIHGDIPINAGVSSSSALVVMWLRFLANAADEPLGASPEDFARLGHEAEVLEFGEPGGMMDHFCAALGGVLFIDTTPPYAAQRLSTSLEGIVLGNSLEPKATIETLARVRSEVAEGVRLVKTKMPSFDLAKTALDDVVPLLNGLSHTVARRLRANLINRELTAQARAALDENDLSKMGRLLLAHHEQLRDGLDLSTPKIERMLNAALDAGAVGGKINGSGGGGCMFAYAPGSEEAVAEAIRRAGGVPYIVSVADGVSPTS